MTAPHSWDAALGWTLPVWLCIAADYGSPVDSSAPQPAWPAWCLDARFYALFGLQWLNILWLLNIVSHLGFATLTEVIASTANLVALRILAGTTSCCSAIALAHELIHRRPRHLRWMGRMLLWTVCYDHFAVEHGRGHHRLASTADDPATARFNEGFDEFFRRSVCGQWRDAWHLEARRLAGLAGVSHWLRHRVLQGVVIECGLLGLILVYFGPLALFAFLYQSWAAVRLLEAVNYVQHWGLIRAGTRFSGADAWATDSWFTLHAFIGLSRHADHHLRAGKPCQHLQTQQDSPKLPHGYFVMALMVRLRNDHYRELAGRELRGRNLGPFRLGRVSPV